MPVQCTCDYCGKPFSRSKSRTIEYQHTFCSAKCRANFLRRDIHATCSYCGAAMVRKPAESSRYKRLYCSKVCMGKDKARERSEWWKDGTTIDGNGYIRVSVGKGKTRLQHRIVMEEVVGRPLQRHEHVHHINGVRDDNRPENLQLVTQSEHMRLHYGGRWSIHGDCCVKCGTTERKHKARGLCDRCYHSVKVRH